MDLELRDKLLDRWHKYFNQADLPIVFYYTDNPNEGESPEQPKQHRCIIADMYRVRKGKTLVFNENNLGCGGAVHYLGYRDDQGPNFKYFLSCGIPNELEGERYKKSPELVTEMMKHSPHVDAGGQWIVFKRWDMLKEDDDPEVVICFAEPDLLSAFVMLANYDTPDPHGVKIPMGSGCASTIRYPYAEKFKETPSGIVGMFDPSARPFVKSSFLTFASPMERFSQLIDNMDESFLITESWKHISNRIK
jgi:uncharacterized protein (DUF169 family)